MNWRFWQSASKAVTKVLAKEPENPYHVQFVDEKPGTDHHGNSITWVRLRCAKTKKTWTEMDYGRNRYNTTMERSCNGCGLRINGEDFQQDQWGHSREAVQKILGLSDEKDGLTRAQKELLKAGKCPDCNGDQWFEGPSGGMSTNYKCATEGCGSRFNLALPFFMERISEPQPDRPKELAG